ncbi:hypothetical protein ACWENA_26945 [Streptomyces sp. NPDC004779]
MREAEWAERALRLVTDGPDADPGTARRRARLRLLVEDRLRASELGAAALARLRSEPGEGSSAIAVSVLAEEMARDAAFASFLVEAVTEASGTTELPREQAPAGHPAPLPPPLPPQPAAYPAPGARPPLPPHLHMSTVWIWLLGLPTMMLGYVLSAVFFGPVVLLVVTTAGVGTALVWGVRLLLRYQSPTVLAATVVHALIALLLLSSFLANLA